MKMITTVVTMIIVSMFIVGCGLITVNIVNRHTVDVGDGTNDDYHDISSKNEEKTVDFAVPFK